MNILGVAATGTRRSPLALTGRILAPSAVAAISAPSKPFDKPICCPDDYARRYQAGLSASHNNRCIWIREPSAEVLVT